jgi:hypothetical protein
VQVRPTLDIVVPFYQRDLCKLKVSLRSWLWRDPDHIFGDVYLLWTSADGKMADYSESIEDLRHLGRKYLNGTLHIIDFTQQIRTAHIAGWYAQQLVKLKVASIIKSDFYVVMDSKNTLINDVKSETFFSECGQAIIYADFTYAGWHNLCMPHQAWYRNAAKLFNVTPDKDSRWPGSTSPLTMHTKTVLDMLAHLNEGASLDRLCDGPLCGLMQQPTDQERVTEFTVYLMYAMMKTNVTCSHLPVVKHVFDNARTLNGTAILGATGGGVLNLWRGQGGAGGVGHVGNGYARLQAVQSIYAGHWYCQTFGFQHGALDDILPIRRRTEVALHTAELYRRAGLYNFTSLDEFSRCLAGTDLDLGPDEVLTSGDCVPRWVCTRPETIRATENATENAAARDNSSDATLFPIRRKAKDGRACAKPWQQCGGEGWEGPSCCGSGFSCTRDNPYYSKCKADKASPPCSANEGNCWSLLPNIIVKEGDQPQPADGPEELESKVPGATHNLPAILAAAAAVLVAAAALLAASLRSELLRRSWVPQRWHRRGHVLVTQETTDHVMQHAPLNA